MANWYYSRGNQQLGPVELSALQAMFQRGELQPHELVWMEGMANWAPAGQVPELRGAPTGAGPTAGVVGAAPMSPAGPYAPSAYQHPTVPYSAQPDHSGKATTSMILGIVSLVAWLCPLIGFGVTIPGLILASKGKQSSNRGQAVAGMILNSIGLVLTILNAILGVYIRLHGMHR